VSTPRPSSALGDELTNLGMGLLIGAAILALLLRGAGSVAAWLTGTAQPTGGVETGLAVLLSPGAPGRALEAPSLSPVAYWVCATMLIIAGAGSLAFAWRLLVATGRKSKADSYRIPGIAGPSDVARSAS
jgi:type IV secretion system protein VirD4